MQLNKILSFLTTFFIVLFVLISNNFIQAQNNSLIQAIRLFDSGKFGEAEQLLKPLLISDPENLMVNYYYGAARTENNFYGQQEIESLLKASKTESPLKTDYYLGEQYHAQENWEQAIKYYNRYKIKTQNNFAEDSLLSIKIQQCFNRENPFNKDRITPLPEIVEPPAADSINEVSEIAETSEIIVKKETQQKNDSVPENLTSKLIVNADTVKKEQFITGEISGDTVSKTDADSLKIPEIIRNQPLFVSDTMPANNLEPVVEEKPKQEVQKKIKTGKAIEFIIDSEITYTNTSQFKTDEGKKNYFKSDSINSIIESSLNKADELREKYSQATSYDAKKSFGNEIVSLENKVYSLRDDFANFAEKARVAEYNYWQNATDSERVAFITSLKTLSQTTEPEQQETATVMDSALYIDPKILLGEIPAGSQPAQKDEDELIYKIQIGAYSRGVPAYMKRVYKKLSVLRKIENYTDEKGVVVYTTGNLTNLEDALTMQKQVRQEGVENAYVVPYLNGKRITLKQAKEIANKK